MRVMMTILAIALIGSTALAQTPFKNRRGANAGAQAKPKIDFETEPSVAPTEELDVNEFQLVRKDLVGKVIELEFDRVVALKQSGNGYVAQVTFESGRLVEGLTLLIPEEGLELFQKLSERDGRSPLRTKIYVEVLGGPVSRALGERYRKNKPEGERYSW